MHPMEFKKEKVGTGRFSHLILKNSEIIVGIEFDQNNEFLKALKDTRYDSYLLYPGDQSLVISEIQNSSKRIDGQSVGHQ